MMTAALTLAWLTPVALMSLDGRKRAVAAVAAAAVGLQALIFGSLLVTVVATGPIEQIAGGWPLDVGIRLRADALSLAFATMTAAVIAAAIAMQAARGVASRSFPALSAFLALGLGGLFLTADAFNFYVFFEISMAASFALTAYGGEARQYRAAYTFAIVNLLGTVIFLSAVAGLYHITGTLDMGLIHDRIGDAATTPVLVIAAAMFVAFGVKLGLFPFHFWLPPVYRDASPAVAAMLSGAVANIGAYGLLRFAGGVLPAVVDVGTSTLVWIGSASILYGGLLAISRTVDGEILGYSSISQAGYILVAIGLGGPAGYAAAILQGLVNSLNKTLLFLTREQRGPFLAVAAAIGAWSTAGIPPSPGFFAKAALLRAGIAGEAAVVVCVVALGAALSIAYMARFYIRRCWRRPTRPATLSPSGRAVLAMLAFVVLALGVWPEPIVWMSDHAARLLE